MSHNLQILGAACLNACLNARLNKLANNLNRPFPRRAFCLGALALCGAYSTAVASPVLSAPVFSTQANATQLHVSPAAATPPLALALIDNFNHPHNTALGYRRIFLTDTVSGGGTQATHKTKEGVLYLKGEITPPPDQPGWASWALPLAKAGSEVNASQYQGLRLMIKVQQGNVAVSANSTEVTNFDYLVAPIEIKADNTFHEVTIPFNTMQRTWSAQSPLNLQRLNSVSVVVYSLKPESFDIAVGEVGFY